MTFFHRKPVPDPPDPPCPEVLLISTLIHMQFHGFYNSSPFIHSSVWPRWSNYYFLKPEEHKGRWFKRVKLKSFGIKSSSENHPTVYLSFVSIFSGFRSKLFCLVEDLPAGTWSSCSASLLDVYRLSSLTWDHRCAPGLALLIVELISL